MRIALNPCQVQLWQAAHNNDYVADPQAGAGSLHSWGVAVDATLVDMWNRPVLMPTDFDDFTPAAMWHYRGADPATRWHVHLLQIAMRDAGFYGLRTEWWHFTITDWQKYLPPQEAKRAMEVLERAGKANHDRHFRTFELRRSAQIAQPQSPIKRKGSTEMRPVL